ncbi:MAG: DUF664 domain-containing protein, partial [Ferrimicrobium sp.]
MRRRVRWHHQRSSDDISVVDWLRSPLQREENEPMVSEMSKEYQALSSSLTHQRSHIFEALAGLESKDLHRRMLPSHWTCLGLVNHLSLDVERFWFQAVIAGDQSAIADALDSA